VWFVTRRGLLERCIVAVFIVKRFLRPSDSSHSSMSPPLLLLLLLLVD